MVTFIMVCHDHVSCIDHTPDLARIVYWMPNWLKSLHYVICAIQAHTCDYRVAVFYVGGACP